MDSFYKCSDIAPVMLSLFRKMFYPPPGYDLLCLQQRQKQPEAAGGQVAGEKGYTPILLHY